LKVSAVVIGKPEQQVLKASHCGSKQQKSRHGMITLLLLVCATYIWVLFFAHILFLVNRTFNATATERLQHCRCQKCYAILVHEKRKC